MAWAASCSCSLISALQAVDSCAAANRCWATDDLMASRRFNRNTTAASVTMITMTQAVIIPVQL